MKAILTRRPGAALLRVLLASLLMASAGLCGAAPTASQLADWGIIDVTLPPYSADPAGKRDATKAIQQAVNDARDGRLIVFLPPGEYLVSDTIIANQQTPKGRGEPLLARRDEYPCVIWGGTKGGRATIVLADRAPGFGDPSKPKPVLYSLSYRTPTESDNPNISFNQLMISFDVELGDGNPGAIGVDHQGAQGTATEDVHVNASGAFAGFRGTSGSGGGVSHISVRGGRYGLYLDATDPFASYAGSQPSPVISAVELTGQTEKSIYAATRGPLTLVGAAIDGPGIHLAGRPSDWDGALNMIDSVIRHRGPGAVITGVRPVYLSNVYVENAASVVSIEGAAPLAGNAGGWTHIAEYAVTPSEKYPIWIDGERGTKPFAVVERGKAPPAGLRQPHQWLDPLPAWNDAQVANVKAAPYSAKGDGRTDDWEAIQKAINEHRDVFLPKGIYRISKPLRLRRQSRLFGIGVHSKIEALPEAPAFADAKNASPLLIAPNDRDATCVAAFLQLWCRHPGSYAIHWQAGGGSMVRNVRTLPRPPVEGAAPADHPVILIDGNGGGRWYNALMHTKFPQTLRHRHVLARGTREPLRFYMLNPEHSLADYMVEFDDVRNVRVYAVKSETIGASGPRELTPFLIRNSEDFAIYGHGGNASPPSGQPMYRVENCRDFIFTNFGYQYFEPASKAESWFMVEEKTPAGQVIRVPGTDFFTLYKRR